MVEKEGFSEVGLIPGEPKKKENIFLNHIWGLGMGIGDWGLGIGDWAQSPIPQSPIPIPNPQSPSPIPNFSLISIKNLKNLNLIFKILLFFISIHK